jgi:hypothetical protein
MKLPRRKFLHLAASAAALPAVSRIAWAQAYPSRPVRIMVGFAAGSFGVRHRLFDIHPSSQCRAWMARRAIGDGRHRRRPKRMTPSAYCRYAMWRTCSDWRCSSPSRRFCGALSAAAPAAHDPRAWPRRPGAPSRDAADRRVFPAGCRPARSCRAPPCARGRAATARPR